MGNSGAKSYFLFLSAIYPTGRYQSQKGVEQKPVFLVVSHGTGPTCPGPSLGHVLLVILQSQRWAGPAGSCCAHPTRPLQTGKRFLPRLPLTHIKAHARSQDSLPLLHTGWAFPGSHITNIRQGLPAPRASLLTHLHTPTNYSNDCYYTEQEHELSRYGTMCCKPPLCICRLPGANGIPSQCHKLLS